MDAEVYPTRRDLESVRRDLAENGGGILWIHQADCRSEFGGECDCEAEPVDVEAAE